MQTASQRYALTSATSPVVDGVTGQRDETDTTVVVGAVDRMVNQQVDVVLVAALPEPLERAAYVRLLREVLRSPHPRVATVIDSGVRGLRPFLVLPASSRPQSGGLVFRSQPEAAQLALDVCAGLAALLEQGLSWLIPTPDRVRVDQQGRAQVVPLPAQSDAPADEPAALLAAGSMITALTTPTLAGGASRAQGSAEGTPAVDLAALRAIGLRALGYAQPVMATLAELMAELSTLAQVASPVDQLAQPEGVATELNPSAVEPEISDASDSGSGAVAGSTTQEYGLTPPLGLVPATTLTPHVVTLSGLVAVSETGPQASAKSAAESPTQSAPEPESSSDTHSEVTAQHPIQPDPRELTCTGSYYVSLDCLLREDVGVTAEYATVTSSDVPVPEAAPQTRPTGVRRFFRKLSGRDSSLV